MRDISVFSPYWPFLMPSSEIHLCVSVPSPSEHLYHEQQSTYILTLFRTLILHAFRNNMFAFFSPFCMKQLDARLAESKWVAGRIDGPRVTITVKLSTTTTPSSPLLTIIAIFSPPVAISDCSPHCFEPKSFRFTIRNDRRHKLSSDGAADDPDCPGLGSKPLNVGRTNARSRYLTPILSLHLVFLISLSSVLHQFLNFKVVDITVLRVSAPTIHESKCNRLPNHQVSK